MRRGVNPSRSLFIAATIAGVISTLSACRPVRATVESPPSADQVAQFWVEPEPNRDLFCGVGGCDMAPDPAALYTIIEPKRGGFSAGFSVRDPRGREWSAKLLPEGRTEVVASRLFWGLGYHQPPLYYLDSWNAVDPPDPNPQAGARFRQKTPDFYGIKEGDSWSYYENPFVGTRPMNGLIVLHVMLGSSDLKDENNSVYTLREPHEGATTWYVARDIGQSFGRARIISAPRGDIEEFESTGFILGVKDGKVQFDWGGRHKALASDIAPADVVWICRRLDALTDQQWHDAFRAGGFTRQMADRFIRHMKTKIAAGLKLES